MAAVAASADLGTAVVVGFRTVDCRTAYYHNAAESLSMVVDCYYWGPGNLSGCTAAGSGTAAAAVAVAVVLRKTADSEYCVTRDQAAVLASALVMVQQQRRMGRYAGGGVRGGSLELLVVSDLEVQLREQQESAHGHQQIQ